MDLPLSLVVVVVVVKVSPLYGGKHEKEPRQNQPTYLPTYIHVKGTTAIDKARNY